MKVIFGETVANELKNKFTVLELDTFIQDGLPGPLTAYAVLESTDIPLPEITTLKNMTDMHNAMLNEYKNRRFDFCIQALEHLKGKWKGTLDSFYTIFEERVMSLKDQKLDETWSPYIVNRPVEN